MIISARSPYCIHDPERRHYASNCSTCPTDNVEYQRWVEFWESLPYEWVWDESADHAGRVWGHFVARDTGKRVGAVDVFNDLRSQGVTVTWLG